MAVSAPDAAGEQARELPKPGPHVLVLFGATGDLARRKLIPGLFHLEQVGMMPDDYRIVGASLDELDDEGFRDHVRDALREFCRMEVDDENWKVFSERLSYVPSRADALAAGVARAEEAIGGEPRRLYYLSVPPSAAGPDRSHARGGRAGRARPGGDGEAVRNGSGLGPRAQRDGARGVRRGPDLQDRPLPGQGSGAEHAGPAVRQRLPRAAVEPRAHRPRADRRARDARRSARAASSTRARAPSAT